jgi:hypothetical protein
MTPVRTIEVRRDAISRTRAVTEAQPHPADGQAVLRVERFSLSANNLTYARLGGALRYSAVLGATRGDRRALSRRADTTGLPDSLDTTKPPAPRARAARPRPGG